MGPHESLIYEVPLESEEDLLEWVMAAADVGDRAFRNMGPYVRYRVCVEVAGRHIVAFCKWTPVEKQPTVIIRSGRFHHVMLLYFVCTFKTQQYVCVFQCQPTAVLRASGIDGVKCGLFLITHRLGRPHYVWDEYLYSVWRRLRLG